MQTRMTTMSTTFIGETYSPSFEPISSLTPITLHELWLETHHRGRILIVRTFCEPIRRSAIQNAIEDVRGDVDRLSIYNLPSTTRPDRILPKSAIVAVKEPYLEATIDGGFMVRVDHPSDFVLLEPDEDLVPPQWKRSARKTVTGSQLKESGNTAFKQGEWQKARQSYSEALTKNHIDTDLRLTLLRNRAQVHLNLGQYECASDDAIASVIFGDNLSHEAKSLNVKSYFRAGRAQYELGNFSLAYEYLEQALDLNPKDNAIMVDLKRTQQRILEQQSGEYDFSAMAQSATSSHRKLDHASFTSNTMIASSANRGRGLFAAKEIKRGSVVMVEKAFCANFGGDLGKDYSLLVSINTDRMEIGTCAERLYELTDKIIRNPHHASRFLNLYDGGKFKQKQVSRVDGAVVVDTFQVQAIAGLNGFECPSIRSSLDVEEGKARQSTGVWIHASYINHSCLPNTCTAFIGDMMIVRATDDIKAGEEIFTTYNPVAISFPKRNEKFSMWWGFQCDCRLCQLESQLPAAVFTERDRLAEEAKDFIAANPRTLATITQPVDKAIIAKGKDILSRLHATYDKQIYGKFPRLDCVSIELWLVQAGLASHAAGLSPMVDIATTTRLLQDLGYELKVKGSEASIDTTNGYVCAEVVHAAIYGAEAWRLAGRPQAGKTLVELAKEVHLCTRGDMQELKEKMPDL